MCAPCWVGIGVGTASCTRRKPRPARRGQDNFITIFRRNFSRGVTFEAPRQSLVTVLKFEIFDDLLIGNASAGSASPHPALISSSQLMSIVRGFETLAYRGASTPTTPWSVCCERFARIPGWAPCPTANRRELLSVGNPNSRKLFDATNS